MSSKKFAFNICNNNAIAKNFLQNDLGALISLSIGCRPAPVVGVKIEVKEADAFALVAHPS